MILVQWSCEIPQEKIESFLNLAEENLRRLIPDIFERILNLLL